MHCYNNEISYFKECIQKKNKLTGLLKHTEQELIREKLHMNKMLSEYEKEEKDVLKLESANITSLFYTILGSKEEQLLKERQEALKSKLKYDQSKNNVDYLVEETKRIVNELEKIKYCEKEYEELINLKLKEICTNNSDISAELKKLIDRKENFSANIKEINEAIEAGEEALKLIEKTIKELEKAEGWGIWDMLGGGFITTMVKHSHIDNACEYAEEIQRLLNKFKRELSDINMFNASELSVGAFETFTDYFFDGLIFDWIVQSEINKSLDSVENLKVQVDKAISQLEEEKITEEFLLKQLEEQVNNIIEKA